MRSQRGYHYRQVLDKQAKEIAEGRDPAEVQQKERVPYQYVPANYDIYLEQMQKKQEVAAQKAANRQAII